MKTRLLPAPLRWLLKKRRDWRFRSMLSSVRTWEEMTVLDIGCGHDGRSFSDHADRSWRITGIDLHAPETIKHRHPYFTYRQADAASMPFPDKSFDLAVSVGMLEHVTDEEAFRAVCREIQRVAKQYVVVVPYKWAWIEPHHGIPFFGAFPAWMQGRARERTVWRSNREYREAFPGSRIQFLPVLETIAVVKAH